MRWLEWLKSQVRGADDGNAQKVPVGRLKDQQGGFSLGGPARESSDQQAEERQDEPLNEPDVPCH
jgi:hypothetical protein